jgi:hypothetical protein
MDDINAYVKGITDNMQKLLQENERVLNILSAENPELADQIMRDVNESMKAVKTNDINRINQIYERYANNTDQ